MQEILDDNFHFMKRNDSLYFELPEKFQLAINQFKSLRQLNITTKDYYEMYEYTFSDDRFIIKFKDNATMSDSKNTIIEFKRITKDEFMNGIEEAMVSKKKRLETINSLINELEKQPQITLNSVNKLPLKSQRIQNDKGDEIFLRIPNEIELKESGDIKNEAFGPIKIGTFKDNSKIYDVEHNGDDYGLKQLTIWVSTDTSTFNMAEYLSENPDIHVFRKDKNSIVGYEIGYDFENESAEIHSFFCLKYYHVGNSHIFIYSDVYRSQMKNFPNLEEMNKILNFNYSISENITIQDN